ncbi:hypothetical protein GOB83_09955 [Acetobacter fabarum]|nr:hypothetical protein [Acetobacter fabarum]
MDDEADHFFDVEERLARLSRLGDQFEALSRTLDFEMSVSPTYLLDRCNSCRSREKAGEWCLRLG